MTDDLLGRLTNPMVPYDPEVDAQGFWEDLCADAKDRIEALTAERKEDYRRLSAAAADEAHECGVHKSRAEAAEADNARLLNDLKVISQFHATTSCTANIYSIWKMTERARAALTGKETK